MNAQAEEVDEGSLRPAAAPGATAVSVQRGTFSWEPGELVFRTLACVRSLVYS